MEEVVEETKEDKPEESEATDDDDDVIVEDVDESKPEEEKKAELMLKDFSWGQTKAYVVLYPHSVSVDVANDYVRKKAQHYPASQAT